MEFILYLLLYKLYMMSVDLVPMSKTQEKILKLEARNIF